MKCHETQKLLSAYADGEMQAEKMRVIDAHVQSCGSCQRKIEEIESLWKALDVLPVANPSPYFYAKLASRIRAEERKPASGWSERLLIPISAAAIAVLGFWLGTLAGNNGDTTGKKTLTTDPIVSTSYLDTFDSVPTASFGEVYLALAGQD
jgi:predicted anti-sigma-YlaC factor YlaD